MTAGSPDQISIIKGFVSALYKSAGEAFTLKYFLKSFIYINKLVFDGKMKRIGTHFILCIKSFHSKIDKIGRIAKCVDKK
jgi:hypothetical protein